MSAEAISPSERIASAFEKLKVSAANINQISNQLGSQISSLDRALQRLNVGVACWTKFNGDSDEDRYWSHDVGYARVNGNWGLSIRSISGWHHTEDRDHQEEWPFNEAPRYMRVKAAEKLPDLIESMVESTNAAAARLEEKIEPTKELATAVHAVLAPKKK